MRLLCLSLVLLLAGCATVERTGYIAVETTTLAVELSRQGYIAHANSCHCVTQAEFDVVRQQYEKYQSACDLLDRVLSAYKQDPAGNENAFLAASRAVAESASGVVSLIEKLLPPAESGKLKTKIKGATAP